MSAEKAQNVQDVFLNAIRKHKTPVTVFVVLLRNTVTQMVYKHAISTIMPSAPVQLFEPKDEAGGKEEAGQ